MNYEKYMRSPKWRAKRQHRLKLDDNTCQSCGATPDQYRLEVHHLTYERLGNEEMDDLKTLCVICHPTETAEQRRKRYAKRVIVVCDTKRKTPTPHGQKERNRGIQEPALQDYRRRTPSHA
jgi:HNH endonuclease